MSIAELEPRVESYITEVTSGPGMPRPHATVHSCRLQMHSWPRPPIKSPRIPSHQQHACLSYPSSGRWSVNPRSQATEWSRKRERARPNTIAEATADSNFKSLKSQFSNYEISIDFQGCIFVRFETSTSPLIHSDGKVKEL